MERPETALPESGSEGELRTVGVLAGILGVWFLVRVQDFGGAWFEIWKNERGAEAAKHPGKV